MQEVTKWNNKPRFMWVWNLTKANKIKAYVVYILSEEEMTKVGFTNYPVCSYNGNFMSCAEIEEEPMKETTRLTHYELSQLLKCFGVEYKPLGYEGIDNSYVYSLESQNLHTTLGLIRYKQSEWMSATRETVWKWWGEETPDSDIVKFVSFIWLG